MTEDTFAPRDHRPITVTVQAGAPVSVYVGAASTSPPIDPTTITILVQGSTPIPPQAPSQGIESVSGPAPVESFPYYPGQDTYLSSRVPKKGDSVMVLVMFTDGQAQSFSRSA